MNIEKELKNIIQSQVQTIDEDNFINNLHFERKHRHAKKIGFMCFWEKDKNNSRE